MVEGRGGGGVHYTPSGVPPALPRVAGLAIASLVLGIVGLIMLPVVASVLALVFGYVALSQIKRANGWVTGRGMAIAGIITGWAGVVVVVLVIAAVVLVANTDESHDVRRRVRPVATTSTTGPCVYTPAGNDPGCGWGATDTDTDKADGRCDQPRYMEDPDCGSDPLAPWSGDVQSG